MEKRNLALIFVLGFIFSMVCVNAENYIFNASEVVSYLYDASYTQPNGCSNLIDCIAYDGNGDVSVAAQQGERAGGNTPYNAYIKTATNASLPHDISVLDVFACVKAAKNDEEEEDCYIHAMENSSGVWKEKENYFSCSDYPVSVFATKCINVTDFFNLTKLNFSGIGWKFNYTSTPNDIRSMTLDWFYLNVSYIPLQFLSWQSNASTLMRGESAKISAEWQIKDIALAKIRHNFSGSFEEYELTPDYPWTNYTIVFANSQPPSPEQNTFYITKPGYYEISYIYAQDSYGGYNKTFPSLGLKLYGYAKVSEISVNDSYIYPSQGVRALCKVMDANTSEPISNYNVSFYADNNFIGSALTNSSGYAEIEASFSSLGEHEIKCNITDAPEIYYNASEENEKASFVKVLNLSVMINLNSTSLNYGDGILIKANITNASSIVFAKLNHSFVNITDYCALENASVIRDMQITKCFFNDLCEAEISFIPKRSGKHNLTLCINASSPYGIACNFSSFSVSFGKVSPKFWIPYYFVLSNQTFNITANVTSLNGDVWNVNVSLDIDGKDRINLSSSEKWYKIIEGVKNSSTCFAKFRAYSNNTGLLKMFLYSSPENGTASRFSESFEVIKPEKDKNSNISFSPESIYIDEFTIIKANIIGNATPARVNFTVLKPWNSGNESFVFQKVQAVNPEKCGIVFETGNIASLAKNASASASANNNTAIYAIDEDNSTAWSWGESAELNITFKKPDYAVERIEIRWQKIVNQDVNASIYYIDPNGILNTFAENIPLPASVDETVFSDFRPFKAGKLILNFTGGVSVYEVRVYPTIPRSDKCYVFSVNFTSQNLTYSGFYNTFASVVTETGNIINLKNASFFVRYGKPIFEISSYTPNAILIGRPENYSVIVKAYRGDLRNFTLRWNSSDLNYLNITPNENFTKNFTFLRNGNSIEVSWGINATGIPSGMENYTVETYVNTFSELGRIGEESNTSFNITIYPEDTQPPVINSFWFEINGKKTNVTNVNFTLSIIANVSDNIWVRYVNATVIYPDGNKTSVKFSKISNNIWGFTFGIDGVELNQTGNYSIRVEAVDIAYNETVSNFSKLNVTNKLYIFIESPSLLNRGEYLNLSARDVNNLTVKNVLFNFSAKAVNENFSISNSSRKTFFTLFINSSYPQGIYNASVIVKIYNNTGSLNFSFQVSSELVIEIIAPPENAVFDPGAVIFQDALPRVKVYNIRKDKEIVSNVSVNVTCLNSSYKPQTHILSYGGCGYYNDTYSFSDCEAKCYAPKSYGKDFSIVFEAIDAFNNSGINSVSLKTSSPPQTQEQKVISGGGGASMLPPPVCNCTEWKDVGCGIGNCGIEEMYQERNCMPSNCSIEARCIKHPACIIPTDFEITILNTSSEVVKGESKIFHLIISNPVKKTIKINVSIEAEDCEVIYDKTITLEPKMEKLYDIKVIPFLNASSSSTLRFVFSSENITKEGSIELKIKENPVVEEIKKTSIIVEKKLLEKINYLKNAGVETGDLEEKIRKIKELVNESYKYIQANDLASLKKTSEKVQKIISEVENKVKEREAKVIYALLMKNAKWIILGIIILVYVAYLFSNIFLPYLRYRKLLKKLAEKEKELVRARIETEKQFFMRKIDEKTFRELIVKRQHEIIGTRAKIKEIRNEMKTLWRKGISPIQIGSWIKNTVRNIPKTVKVIKIGRNLGKKFEKIKEKIKKFRDYIEYIYWIIRLRF